MKKQITLGLSVALTLLGAAATAEAQGPMPEPHMPRQHGPAATAAHKGTGIGSRLLAITSYGFTTDSSRYIYPNASTDAPSQINDFYLGNGAWSPSYKELYTYDAGGFLTQLIKQQVNSGGTFDNYYKYTYTNNAAGAVTDELIQGWNGTAWGNSQHYIYTLNSANQITEQVYQQWNASANAWVNNDRYTHTYNAQGGETQRLYQLWSTSTNSWQNDYRYDYTNDASGTHITQANKLNWNTATAAWDNSSQDVYTLNSNGQPLQVVENIWDTITSHYDVPSVRSTYAYDAAGDETSRMYGDWNATSGSFDDYSLEKHTYNSFNQVTLYTLAFYSSAGNLNAASDSFIYYYESYTTTGIAHLTNSGAVLSISPVPANNSIHLSLMWDDAQSFSAAITDIQGKVYQTFSAPSAKEFSTLIDVANMPAGNYLLSIKGGKGGAASRMITVAH